MRLPPTCCSARGVGRASLAARARDFADGLFAFTTAGAPTYATCSAVQRTAAHRHHACAEPEEARGQASCSSVRAIAMLTNRADGRTDEWENAMTRLLLCLS